MARAAALLLTAVCACGGERCDAAPGLGLEGGQCAAVAAIQLPAQLPPARGNAKGDDPAAATFGHHVFFDARFSSSNNVRCASCHETERAFQDGAPTPPHFAVTRNTPTVLNAARFSWIFWDGRADSVWSQALFAFENPAEMDFTRLEIAHLVDQLYRASYEKAFGALPDFSDTARFPPRGAPGQAPFDGMAEEDRRAVNRVAANVGKAIEAYERKASAGRSRVDAWLAGDRAKLSPQEQKGLAVAARTGCLGCHSGPLLSDEGFHNLGVPAAEGTAPDHGREAGLPILLANPFNGRGEFWDGPRPPQQGYGADPAQLGAFRTPPLRNLKRTAPYGHNGRFATLDEVVDFHLAGGGHEGFVGQVDPALKPATLGEDDRAALIAFLLALEGQYPGLPWADWPRG